MPRYLISFNYGDMQVDPADMPAVGEAAHAVVHEARAAGVLVFAGGVLDPDQTWVVARDGSARHGTAATRAEFIAGVTIVETAGPEDARAWAARIAAACRCAQEVREFGAGSLP